MIRMHKFLLAAASMALPFAAFAHAGHSNFSADHMLHYLATPDHAVPVISGALLVIIMAFKVRKQLALRAVRNRKK